MTNETIGWFHDEVDPSGGYSMRPPLELVPRYDLTQINDAGVRTYVTPNGDVYPSVTTVLSKKPNPTLDEWKERVGPDEAKRISQTSITAGNALHEALENYILGKELPYLGRGHKRLFNAIKPKVDNLDAVHGIELPLWSDRLKLAGTSDLIATRNGKLSIIDFKNSKSDKRREWIDSYIIQGSIYAMMYMEIYKVPVTHVAIFVALWDGSCQVFEEKVSKSITQVYDFMKKYHPMW